MSIWNKRVILCIICGILAIALFGCSRDAEAAPSPVPSPTATAEPTKEPEVTEEPTEEPTDSPTEEPESFQSEIKSDRACNLNLYGDIANPDAVHAPIKWDGQERPMGQTETCAWQFIATTEVMQMDISTATYGGSDVSIIFNVYKWEDSYDISVLEDPVFTETRTGIKDNQSIRFKFSEHLPAGEYLCVISQPSASFTVWTIPYTEDVEYPYTRFYTNGKPQTGIMPQVKIRYANTPVDMVMEFTI
jgi:hypothetical protein